MEMEKLEMVSPHIGEGLCQGETVDRCLLQTVIIRIRDSIPRRVKYSDSGSGHV